MYEFMLLIASFYNFGSQRWHETFFYDIGLT